MAELDYKYISTLVSHARTGDSDSFAELYAATYQKVYRFAYNYLKDEYLAQDALQEAYILALKNLYTLKDSRLFISWLNQINFRVCFNMQQKRKRYNRELSDYDDGNITQSIKHHSDVENPEDQIVKIDEQNYIMKKILDLPPAESQVIIMKYYENMKLEEIAQIMNISCSTVKRHLKRGRAMLGQLLER
ncbi:MAG: sigma-70 family RNA polymerase sigma factor [Muricomes sp.]